MSYPVTLRTSVWNPGGARRVLLLHGLGSDGGTMWRLADAAASAGTEVVVPDLRGHGGSPYAPDLSVEAYAADVRRLGDGWDLVVGHSLGGSILAVLLAEPGFASRGLLLDPVIRLEPADRVALEMDLRGEAGDVLTAEALRRDHPTWDEEDVFRKVRASATVSPSVTQGTLRDNDPWDVMASVRGWACPVDIVAADPALDALFHPAHAHEVGVQASQEIVVTTLTGAGHSVHRDAPQRVLEVLWRRLGSRRP